LTIGKFEIPRDYNKKTGDKSPDKRADNYTVVRFNPINGALSAIHKDHFFDPTIGRFGIINTSFHNSFKARKIFLLERNLYLCGSLSDKHIYMDFIFSRHAIEQMSRRGINPEAVMHVVSFPDQTIVDIENRLSIFDQRR